MGNTLYDVVLCLVAYQVRGQHSPYVRISSSIRQYAALHAPSANACCGLPNLVNLRMIFCHNGVKQEDPAFAPYTLIQLPSTFNNQIIPAIAMTTLKVMTYLATIRRVAMYCTAAAAAATPSTFVDSRSSGQWSELGRILNRPR